MNLCVRIWVISTVRVPTCASSSLHSCCRAAISLSFDSSTSACWARSRARWRANALLYCSADPGLIREGEFTCASTRRKYLHWHLKKKNNTLSVFANTEHSKKWGEPGVPLPVNSFNTNIRYTFMYNSRPWASMFLFKQHTYYYGERCLKMPRLNKSGGSLRSKHWRAYHSEVGLLQLTRPLFQPFSKNSQFSVLPSEPPDLLLSLWCAALPLERPHSTNIISRLSLELPGLHNDAY